MPYEIATPVFEGPFDLLLHLITKEQVDLWEISLATIVDEYVAHIEQMRGLDLEVATEFLLIAAILVELKTRRLLPGRDDGDLDEEFALWEERDLLLSRLLECKTFKDAAQELERMMGRAARSFPRAAGLEEQFLDLAPDLLAGITAERLRDACMRGLTPKPEPRVDLEHVAPVRLSVSEMVEELAAELPRLGRTTFRQLTEGVDGRLHFIVKFLALLELYKQGVIELDQGQTFGELEVSWVGTDDTELSPIEEYQG